MVLLSCKTAWLVLLGTACRHSQLHAGARERFQQGPHWEWVNLSPTAGFRAKFLSRADDATVDRHWHLKALTKEAVPSRKERRNCPVRALRQYFKVIDRVRTGSDELFISTQSYSGIVANTIASWAKRLKYAYQRATPEVLERFRIPTNEPNLLDQLMSYELRSFVLLRLLSPIHP